MSGVGEVAANKHLCTLVLCVVCARSLTQCCVVQSVSGIDDKWTWNVILFCVMTYEILIYIDFYNLHDIMAVYIVLMQRPG